MGENNKTLLDYLKNVKDRKTFLEYVEALIRDHREAVERENQAPESHRGYDAFGWQWDAIQDYFGACIACADANDGSDGEPPVLSEEPSWYAFADFLYGGKIYE